MLKINWNPSLKDLRQFGLTLVIGFGLIGALLLWRGSPRAAFVLWGIALLAWVTSYVWPWMALQLYRIWMGIAFVMGSIMSRVILTIVFFAVITPIALIFKLTGRDALGLKRAPNGRSYWHDHPVISDKSYYDHLY